MSVIDDAILRIVASMLWSDAGVNQNVFNAKISGGGGPYDDIDVADDAEDWLDDMYLNITGNASDEIAGNEVIVYKYDTVGQDWDEVASQAWTWAPSLGTDYLPRAVAALVRLWTTDADVQGKKYLPGFTEDVNDDGLFGPGFLTNLLGFAADWFTPFIGAATGATFTPGVWSVVQELFLPGVDHVAVSAIPAYQRRRKRNVGI
jgi:hypothetical protein